MSRRPAALLAVLLAGALLAACAAPTAPRAPGGPGVCIVINGSSTCS